MNILTTSPNSGDADAVFIPFVTIAVVVVVDIIVIVNNIGTETRSRVGRRTQGPSCGGHGGLFIRTTVKLVLF